MATLVMLGGLTAGMIGQLNQLAGSSGAGNITVMQLDVPDRSLSSLDEQTVHISHFQDSVHTRLGTISNENRDADSRRNN